MTGAAHQDEPVYYTGAAMPGAEAGRYLRRAQGTERSLIYRPGRIGLWVPNSSVRPLQPADDA